MLPTGGYGMSVNLWIVFITIGLTALVSLIEAILNRAYFVVSALVISVGMMVLQLAIFVEKLSQAEASGTGLIRVLAENAEGVPGPMSVAVHFIPMVSGIIAFIYAYQASGLERKADREINRGL